MGISPSQLIIVEVMCESMFYGIYCALFVVVLWALASRRSMPLAHKIMFGMAILMFMNATAHLALVIQQAIQVVVPLQNPQARVAIAAIQFMLGDSVLIWRVWVVWGRNYWIAVGPLIMMLVSAGVTFGLVGNFASTQSLYSSVPSALIAANTVICTGLIAGKIGYSKYRLNKLLGGSGHSSRNTYTGVLLLIIESGALYTVSQILTLILDRIHTQGLHALLDLVIPLIGILPTMIIVLVHFDLVPGTHADEEYTETMRSGFHAASGPRGAESSTVITDGKASRTLRLEGESTGDGVEMNQWNVANASQTSGLGNDHIKYATSPV